MDVQGHMSDRTQQIRRLTARVHVSLITINMCFSVAMVLMYLKSDEFGFIALYFNGGASVPYSAAVG